MDFKCKLLIHKKIILPKQIHFKKQFRDNLAKKMKAVYNFLFYFIFQNLMMCVYVPCLICLLLLQPGIKIRFKKSGFQEKE